MTQGWILPQFLGKVLLCVHKSVWLIAAGSLSPYLERDTLEWEAVREGTQ